MFVDASAIIAILVQESDAAALTRRLEQAVEPCTSPIAVYEAVVGIARVCNVPIRTAEEVLDRFLAEATVRVCRLPPKSATLLSRHSKGTVEDAIPRR